MTIGVSGEASSRYGDANHQVFTHISKYIHIIMEIRVEMFKSILISGSKKSLHIQYWPINTHLSQ